MKRIVISNKEKAKEPKAPKEPKGPKEPKEKARLKTKLKQKVSKTKGHNQSQDLVKLTEQYNAFTKRLQGLVKALMNQHAAMQQMAKAKFQVAQHLAVLSKDTCLYEVTGQTAGADRSTDSVNSYFSIHEGTSQKNNMYADKYKQFVVDYAQEWYGAVTSRIGAGLKKAETMRIELDHYQDKVEALRLSANSTMAKGKQVDTKAAEKLTRNEDKLIKIKETSSKFVNDLCLLMEEVTERSWRDLHPLLVKCSQFESQVTGDEAKGMAALNEVVAALKKIATDHGIKPQARLDDLKKLNAHSLSTRAKDDTRNLALENGFAGLALGGGSGSGSVYGSSVYSSDNNSSYFPPGSTAPGGMGGFPVKVASSDTGMGMPAASPFDNRATSAPSTLSMMNMQAAPAPTLDSMAQAFGSAPSSGNYGGHKASMDSYVSDLSGAPAPPPSSAPPPPPPPTPGEYSSFPGAPAPSPGPYGVPATPSSGGGLFGAAATPASTYNTPQSNMGGYPQPSPMTGNYAQQQQQSPYPQTSPGFSQASPMGGGGGGMNFAQQPSQPSPAYGQPPPPRQQQQQPPMSMYGSPPPQPSPYQHHSAPPSYNHNPSNPFG